MKAESMDRIYVALDTVSLEKAQSLARLLKGKVGGVKLGKEFFSAHGPAGGKHYKQRRVANLFRLKIS